MRATYRDRLWDGKLLFSGGRGALPLTPASPFRERGLTPKAFKWERINPAIKYPAECQKALDPSRKIAIIEGPPFTDHVGPLPHNDIQTSPRGMQLAWVAHPRFWPPALPAKQQFILHSLKHAHALLIDIMIKQIEEAIMSDS